MGRGILFDRQQNTIVLPTRSAGGFSVERPRQRARRRRERRVGKVGQAGSRSGFKPTRRSFASSKPCPVRSAFPFSSPARPAGKQSVPRDQSVCEERIV